jgi:hypothetical protein
MLYGFLSSYRFNISSIRGISSYGIVLSVVLYLEFFYNADFLSFFYNFNFL